MSENDCQKRHINNEKNIINLKKYKIPIHSSNKIVMPFSADAPVNTCNVSIMFR